MSEAIVRIGTSGWSYPTGRGTWNGVFYPAPAPRAGNIAALLPTARVSAAAGNSPYRRPRSVASHRGGDFPLLEEGSARPPAPAGLAQSRRGQVDELAYYAEHFDTVEVNSSFYRVPAPNVTRSWAARTPPGFEFSVKLFQKFTHPAMFAERAVATPPAMAAGDVDEFRRALDPLASAGKLGALLAQFPPSFHADEASRGYLDWLLGAFGDYDVAVELRHRSWSDRQAGTEALLGAHGAAWVQIDEPKFRFSIRQRFVPNVAGIFYLRLHGRNAAQWWNHDAAEDRYNYLYTAEELEPIAEATEMARRVVKKLYLYLNNHFEAKAVANAVQLQSRLGVPVRGLYPETFTERFPALAGLIDGSRPLISPSPA